MTLDAALARMLHDGWPAEDDHPTLGIERLASELALTPTGARLAALVSAAVAWRQAWLAYAAAAETQDQQPSDRELADWHVADDASRALDAACDAWLALDDEAGR